MVPIEEPEKKLPVYKTLSQQLNTVMELDQTYRTRFVDAQEEYFRLIDEPNRKDRLDRQWKQLLAKSEAGETHSKPLDDSGPVPKLDRASQALVNLDETLMWAPRRFREGVVKIVKEYDCQQLSSSSPGTGRGYIETKLRELYAQE